RLQLGLFDYEAHFAHYAPGALYERHRDTFASDDPRPRRVLSTVAYLNEGWEPADGGELLVFDAAGAELARVAPSSGAAVLFLSAEFPHEVRPARRERWSIAGWLRRRGG